MNTPFTSLALALACLLMALTPVRAVGADPRDATSSTVIGPNVLLSDGADALMKGEWERGIELTRLGMSMTSSKQDRAAALSNLCGGYAALKKYERALESCNQSLSLDQGNWRTWQNRAAAHLGLGRIAESLSDIERGLEINPDSEALQKTLAIARDQEKLQQERLRHLLES